jgi:hypothetical protein
MGRTSRLKVIAVDVARCVWTSARAVYAAVTRHAWRNILPKSPEAGKERAEAVILPPVNESDPNGMKLDDLFRANEGQVHSWLSGQGLVHECDCGYTVYDPDAVNEAAQSQWGDERCDEIFDWACNLSNQFGWMFLESSTPDYEIFHCQHCADSEWSLLLDMGRIADKAGEERRAAGTPSVSGKAPSEEPPEHLMVYVDESYENEFPRKPGGCYAYAAVVIPESAVAGLGDKLQAILAKCYRGRLPKELKHQKVMGSGRLLECIGPKIVELLGEIPAVQSSACSCLETVTSARRLAASEQQPITRTNSPRRRSWWTFLRNPLWNKQLGKPPMSWPQRWPDASPAM